MLRLWPALRAEYALQLRGAGAAALLHLSMAAGLASVLWPAVVTGADATLAGYGALSGAVAAMVLAVVGGPALVLAGLGRELDSGTRSVRLLAGAPPLGSAWTALLASLSVVVTVVVAGAGAGLVAGTADWARRRLWGPSVPVTRPSWPVVAELGATVVAFCLVTWSVVLALRSGRRAAGALVVVVASWLLVLLAGPEGPARAALVVHPLGGLWALAYRGRSSELRVDVSPTLAILSIVAWTGLLLVAGWRSAPWLEARPSP